MKEFNVSLHWILYPNRIDIAAVIKLFFFLVIMSDIKNFVTIFRYFISKVNAVIQNL